jgi:hypothetical protein
LEAVISGNPGGKSKHKIYSDALRVEVNRIDPNNPDRRKINALAEKLVSCAVAAEGWAFEEIGYRLEGKPMQPVEHSGEDNRTIHQFSDDELTAILNPKQVLNASQRVAAADSVSTSGVGIRNVGHRRSHTSLRRGELSLATSNRTWTYATGEAHQAYTENPHENTG